VSDLLARIENLSPSRRKFLESTTLGFSTLTLASLLDADGVAVLHRIEVDVIDVVLEIPVIAMVCSQKRRCQSASSPLRWRAIGAPAFTTASVNRRLINRHRFG
jgi:hypothetical protein